ncbi:ABC transporter permease [soil metagenome]|jgi:peptide/nickel transport system permease protein
MGGYLRRNKSMMFGIVILTLIALFVILGRLFWDVSKAAPLSGLPNLEPSLDHPLGTDRQARDLLAVMIVGTPKTIYIGFMAGLIGVTIGTFLALIAAYYGGWIDGIIRTVIDIGLTIPPLLVLILVAVSLKASLSINQMMLVVASLAWLYPARTIRSQALSIRERSYVQVARLSGASSPNIIFREVMPNLLPYLAATFVGSVAAGILASIGLEVLGLSSLETNTLGITIYWANYYAAMLHGLWWWFMPPVIIIVMLFVGLFGITVGLDELANPRTRRTA